MTETDCGCLIDRLFQVSKIVEADYYISINGDEPLLEPEVMKAVLPDHVELDKPVVRGLAREFTNPAEVIDPGNMKMVIGKGGYCLYRSRSPIPYPYTTTQFSYKKYVGVELFNKKCAGILRFHRTNKAGKNRGHRSFVVFGIWYTNSL